MKLYILIILILILPCVNCLEITEVELNPEGSDTGAEWIEFFSENEINLNEYKIVNNDLNELTINKSFSGYLVYEFSKQWLDNSDEKIFIYYDDNLIFETDILDDTNNNEFSWQLCEEWMFKENTKGKENSCEKNIVTKEDDSKEELEDVKKDVKKKKENEYVEYVPFEKNITFKSEPETIKLNAKTIKSVDEKISLSKYAQWVFFVFCVLLIALFVVKKFKVDKNEFA